MGLSGIRKVVCGVMIGVFPLSMWAADSAPAAAPAMLYAKGTAWINGSTVPRTSAVFPGDLSEPDRLDCEHQRCRLKRCNYGGFTGKV